MHETRGEKTFDYCYDANGQLYAVSYKANSSTDFSVNALLIAAILYGYDSSYSTQTVPAT